MSYDYLVITFLIYSFVGYLSEVTYCSIGKRRLVNRGFLYGPWLPIYGFGGLIVKVVLSPLYDYPIAVFILAMILTSLVEYIGSWWLEKMFDIKLWDYSKKLLNINGRVCLLNSTLFGIMSLFCLYVADPYLDRLINKIPEDVMHILANIIVVVLAVDFTLSVVKMNAFKAALQEAREKAKANEEKFKALVAEGRSELAIEMKARWDEEMEKNREKIRRVSRHIISSFPTATSRSEETKAQLERLKARINESKENLKNKSEKLKESIKGRIDE